MRTKRIAAYLIVLALVAGCVPKNITTETGKKYYTANQIAIRINQLQTLVINLETQKILSVDTTRVIVRFCVTANTTLQQVPEGWGKTIYVLWQGVLNDPLVKPHLTNMYIVAAIEVINVALEPYKV